jgi:hypothetical protein
MFEKLLVAMPGWLPVCFREIVREDEQLKHHAHYGSFLGRWQGGRPHTGGP